MKLLNLKVPFGTAKMVRVTGAKFLVWEDALWISKTVSRFWSHTKSVRRANKISARAKPVRVELDEEPCIGFFVHYDNGQTAEVSWSFIRELPPKNSKK